MAIGKVRRAIAVVTVATGAAVGGVFGVGHALAASTSSPTPTPSHSGAAGSGPGGGSSSTQHCPNHDRSGSAGATSAAFAF